MNDRIILITKDVLNKDYLPIYGNSYNSMENLEALAKNGTVFDRFYTAAPSTAMSFLSMFLQKNPYEMAHKKYDEVKEAEKNTVFDSIYNMGYECHIIWDKADFDLTKKYSECYGEHSIFHMIHINQTVGAHNLYMDEIVPNEEVATHTLSILSDEIEKITSSQESKLFVWIHIPHVMKGRNCYGADMDIFDKFIGIVRTFFDDDSIYISADHGNMNGIKNKIAYGFDVYEPAVNIPLITPRIENMKHCDYPVSNTDLLNIIISGEIPQREYVYSDCAYYMQPRRKLAIIKGNYKYIYNKRTKTEELYDLQFDPEENCNIVSDRIYDIDRRVMTPLKQVYFYPRWDEAKEALNELRQEKNRIWRQENMLQHIFYFAQEKRDIMYKKVKQIVARYQNN